jgi:hypothetical protein
MLPKIDVEKMGDNAKIVKELLQSTELYSQKHLQRADKSLKQSFYVHFVLE